MKKICLVVSSEFTVKSFLLGHLAALQQHYQVSLVVNARDRAFLHPYGLTVTVLPIPIYREIRPWHDIKALFKLFRLLRAEHFDVIHSVTPKAGLLAMLAGTWAQIPTRIHTFTGQVWVTRRGGMRTLLKWADRLVAAMASGLLVDSFSQRDFLRDQGIVSPDKATVLANGSISGVDTRRFQPRPDKGREIRRAEKIPEDALVFLYLGRLNRDKGILDLATSFARLSRIHESLQLLLVGPDEQDLRDQVLEICHGCADQVHFVDYTAVPEYYMAAADVFCLPSYREGFGSVVIEAAAVGVPAVASRIYGLTDAVKEGETGLLFPPGDVEGLQRAMEEMIVDPEQRAAMGERARARTLRDFSQERVIKAQLDYYRKIVPG